MASPKTTPLKIIHVVGARPNFMKVAPIMAEMKRHESRFQQMLVHTGQHYDYNMSRLFFDDLNLPEPDEYLNVGAGTHAEQTARVMIAFECVLKKDFPDWVVVVGDVNSTLACALASAKMGIPVAHVEAGLRSGDRSMPEEMNRILTDQMADLLFTPSEDGDANLLREGIQRERIRFVGNVMIDSLVALLPKAISRTILSDLLLEPKEYILVTLHRPSNVDDAGTLSAIIHALSKLSKSFKVVFPVHPRTRQQLNGLDFSEQATGIHFIEPLGYLDFLALLRSSAIVITDSGGIQEETTFLGVPCLTVRPNTERPITIQVGTNQLVQSDSSAILTAVEEVRKKGPISVIPPKYWDGFASRRIVEVFDELGQ